MALGLWSRAINHVRALIIDYKVNQKSFNKKNLKSVGMTLAKVKEQDGMTLAKVKEQDGMTVAK